MPRSNVLHASLALLFSELVDGTTKDAAYMLNSGDAGLLKSLDTLSPAAASKSGARGGATIAAHVDHIRYGLELMNRWNDGEANPWATADWTLSWKKTSVNEAEWKTLRRQLRQQCRRWEAALKTPRELSGVALNGVISSVAHLAYHLGAIRQIHRAARGPKAR